VRAVAGLLAPLPPASARALTFALVGASVTLAALLAVAVLRVVRPRSTDQRSPSGGTPPLPSGVVRAAPQRASKRGAILALLALKTWRYA